MAVIIGSARSDERGKITGGKAGDQKSGREVSTQNYYVHSKGWRVLRATDPNKAPLIAKAMKAACDNNKIGYDQNERNSLYKLAKPHGFDPAKVATACETDCSALVRVCCAYAGIMVNDFNTSTEAKVLLASGAFAELKGDRYTKRSDYLRAGDVLVTKTKGHTVVVLTDGVKAGEYTLPVTYKLGDRLLENGCEGADVKELQEYLIQLGYDCGRWGADGDFGDSTEQAVEQFQRDNKLDADGEYGEKTHAALLAKLDDADKESGDEKLVEIVGGNCYVRTAPNTSAKKLGVAHAGDKLGYGGMVSETGWYLVSYNNTNGWVSGKYGRLVN